MNHDIVMFLSGSAVGAVTAGLIVHLSEQSHRKALEEQVEEALRAAARADEAAIRAHEDALMRMDRDEATTTEAAAHTPTEADEDTAAPAVCAEDVSAAASSPASAHKGRSVRSVLQDRLGAQPLGDMPVIARGAERAASTSVFAHAERMDSTAPRARVFDPQARAALIDRRIPRFDESLFPDTTAEIQTDEDVFSTAMRAMDEFLPATGADEEASATPAQAPQPPEFSDASSYIEYLVEDEMRRNKSQAGRRYSRQHLTVYEGTGDLSAARRALRNRARHLPQISLEA